MKHVECFDKQKVQLIFFYDMCANIFIFVKVHKMIKKLHEYLSPKNLFFASQGHLDKNM